ncbi:MAG TPA: RluA family pseudouridine synthase [Candidatus Cottocaccamicrobium excrementipullorum]|nr:RluA family pseudouridine synthase [Candidatus Cottocaccamicrobium excrementipullorum]
MLNILYEDSQLMVTVKPAGVESQSSSGFGQDMVSLIRNELMKRERQKTEKICTELSTNWGKLSTKPVEKSLLAQTPYVGVIHRLDKPVSGIMVYAKTKTAAAALSRQVQEGKMKKIYLAVVCGNPVDKEGHWVDYLRKEDRGNLSRIVDKNCEGAKRAELSYTVLGQCTRENQEYSLVKIQLDTGRHHQIRVQFSSRNLPLWGDGRYHPQAENGAWKGKIALCAAGLSFVHPKTKKVMAFSVRPCEGAFSWFGEMTDPSCWN